MQTFLPYEDFKESARVLDYRRLGKQRVEAKQLIYALQFPDYGWQHHPATLMWKGCSLALAYYGLAVCVEWRSRGYQDNCGKFFRDAIAAVPPGTVVRLPSWLKDKAFHDSHKSNLLRKNPTHYNKFGWDVPDNLPYVWPGVNPAYIPNRLRRA